MESLTIKIKFDTGQADQPLKKTTNEVIAMTGSFNDLAKRMKDATQALRNSTEGTVAHTVAAKRLNVLTEHFNRVKGQEINTLNQVAGAMSQSTRMSANMGQALMSMNYVVRDSPYFFRNFSLGLLAVGNNFNPLIDSLLRAQKEAQALNSTLGKELFKSLAGTQGIIFAMSLLVSAIQAVVFWMENQNRESKDLEETNKDLESRIQRLTASYEDLAQAQSEYLEQRNADYVKNLTEEYVRLNKQIDHYSTIGELTQDQATALSIARSRVAELSAELGSTFAPNIINNMKALEGAVKSVSEGRLGVFVGLSGLTKGQILNIATQLEYLSENVFTASGEIGSNLEPALEQLADSLDITYAQALKASKAIREFYKDTKESSKSLKESMDVIARALQVGEHAIGGMETVFDIIANRAKVAIEIMRDFQSKYGVIASSLSIDKSGLMTGVKTGEKPEAAGQEEYLKDVNEEMAILTGMADTVGNALYDSFMHGKEGLQGFLDTLKQVVLQMLIVDGLKSIFSGGAVGIFSFLGFDKGGIIPKAENGMISGSSYSGDRQLVRVNAGEMILNKMQQKNLFDIANGKFAKPQSQTVHVNINGQLKANRNEFIAEIKKGLNTISRTNTAKINV